MKHSLLLCLALPLVASACITSTEPVSKPPQATTSRSPTAPLAGKDSSQPIVHLPRFALHHSGDTQLQVVSAVYREGSTSLEVLVLHSGSDLVLGSALQFALTVDGASTVHSESELPWLVGRRESIWLQFPIAAEPNSDMSLDVRYEDESFRMAILTAAPELPHQIDPLLGPFPTRENDSLGLTTVELRSIAFGESSITAELLFINQSANPFGYWFEHRIEDDLGNQYAITTVPTHRPLGAQPRSGTLVSAAFAGRIHPDATSLTLVLDAPLGGMTFANLGLDMPAKLVEPMPDNADFAAETQLASLGLLLSAREIRFDSYSSEVEMTLVNDTGNTHVLILSFDLMLRDDLGNRHMLLPPIAEDNWFAELEPYSKTEGTFRFAGGVSPNASQLQLVATNWFSQETVVGEIQLQRVASPTAPDSLAIRTTSRFVELLLKESESTEELLDIFDAEVQEGRVQLTLPDDVLFEFARSDVSVEGLAILGDVAALVRLSPDSRVKIVGHTDAIGSERSNMTLSMDRAEAVLAVLVDIYGIDPERLTADGVGESRPTAPEVDAGGRDSPSGRQQNRRTEIEINNFEG